MAKSRITILTEPVGLYYNAKIFYKIHIKKIKWGGHSAVTRSLIEGFNKIGFAEYNYRPKAEKEIAEHVHVLAGVDTLKYAIKLKKQGKIKKLTAGPNIVIHSTDYDGIVASPEIDAYLQPCQWGVDIYVARKPEMHGRCFPWPAGVDFNIIHKYPCKGLKEKSNNKVLIYYKFESEQFMYRVEHMLKIKGFHPIIIRYGNYKLEDYFRCLAEVRFSVVISYAESQGICLAEAWAMDVPTLCFNSNYWKWPEENFDWVGASTAPYLTDKTGAFWQDLSELEVLLDNIEEIIKNSEPKKWVMDNMTDEVCAKLFLERVGISH